MPNRFMKGAVILSASMFIIRILSLLYVSPFLYLVGPAGMALYGIAYVPYTLLLTLSTLGIPIGVAKFVSKYNANHEYDTSYMMFKLGFVAMIVLGLIFFAIMWLTAPAFASFALARGEDLQSYHQVADVILTIRVVSFAVIIVPPMSIVRGFFQGNGDMMPTAVSQIVEQLIRIIMILAGSFIVIVLLEGSSATAVKISVFAAFVSAIGSSFVLYLYWKKAKRHFRNLIKQSVPHPKRSVKALIKELLSYAFPFALLSLAPTWFQFIDTLTFNAGMLQTDMDPALIMDVFGIYLTPLSKIIMIPVSFAIAFAQPLVPEITLHMEQRNQRKVRKTLTSAIVLTSFVAIPAVIGISVLSHPLYILLFRDNPQLDAIGGSMFGFGAFLGLFLSLNMIIAAIMQGIGRQKQALFSLGLGVVVKFIGNTFLIPRMGVYGAIVATMLAYFVSITLNYIVIRNVTGVRLGFVLKRHIAVFIFSGVMAASVFLTVRLLNTAPYEELSRAAAGMALAIPALVGVIVYAVLVLYFDLGRVLFGERLSWSRLKGRIFRRG